MQHLVVGTWADITEGCPMRYHVDGSNLAHIVVGTTPHEVEFSVDAEALREFATVTAAALAEVDARYAREEAERDAAERRFTTTEERPA